MQLTVRYSMPPVDVLVMHRWNLEDVENRFMSFHPAVLRFVSALRELRKRSSDAVGSGARIPVPFAVQSDPVRNRMRCRPDLLGIQ